MKIVLKVQNIERLLEFQIIEYLNLVMNAL